MNKLAKRGFSVACIAGVVAAMAGRANAQYTCGGLTGPDIIVGDITGPSNYTTAGGIDAISLGTTSCNTGTVNVQWNASPANTHPVIGGNLYRYSTVNGATRFEQIGQSWLKHAFTALTGSICCTCNGQGGAVLGVGCSDPYTSDRNGNQGGMGPRYQVNAHTGVYPTGTPPHPSGGTNGDLQFLSTDAVATVGGSGAAVRFFGETQYINQDDAQAGNGNNNASYHEMSVTGTTAEWNFSLSPGSGAVGFMPTTVRAQPAVRAWKTIDPTITQTDIQVPGDGLFIISSKATSLGGGMYHYEYNVYNMNSDRDGGTFVVPIDDAIPATNIGFSCPVYRGGDGNGGVNFSSTAWTSTKTGGMLTWATTPQATDNNANAIRWGTSYNFRFDAPVAPVANANVSVGLWKAGAPNSVFAAAQSPGQLTAPLQASGASNPSSVQITQAALLQIFVTPGTQPTSTGLTAHADLSTIHGSANQAFYDDGTHGDVTAGDNVFSYTATLSEPLQPGNLSLPFTVSDAQGRSASAAIAVTATAAPTGQCCTGTTCSLASAYSCTSGGGTWAGAGTNCGASSYSIGSGGGTYTTIVGNGGTLVSGLACDDCFKNVPMPFPFNFFGTNYTNVAIASNGFLTFATVTDGQFADYNNTAIPNGGTPNSNCVYPLWEDMYPVTQGGIYTKTVGSAPNRSFIVEWNNVPRYSTTSSENFQAVFIEATGNIEFRYGAITANSATIGIENAAGNVAYSIPGANVGTGHVSETVTFIPPTTPCQPHCGSADFNSDGDTGTDADIEAFFACLGGNCCATCGSVDFNYDGDTGTDADIEAFFRVLAGGTC